MKVEMQLIPYEVECTQTMVENIPEGVREIKAPDFWNQGYKGQGVTIAVIDSGCQMDHPDLKDRIVGGRNFTAEDKGDINKFNDYNGHGTHVAGTIAASANGKGIIGVAPEAKLLILKVMNRAGQGSVKSLLKAMRYAIDQKVQIISMSLGGSSDIPGLHELIKEAVNKDIAVVCAAANNGDGDPLTMEYAYPACYPEVISVGAQRSRRVADFSNSNNQIDLIAPGVDVLSTYIKGAYASLTGTSMAVPHVTGALALLINWGEENFGRKLSETELYAQLVRRAISVGLPKAAEGNGMLYLTAQDLLESIIKEGKI